jgi:NitT/TauT family transport system substrate-binding protein
VGPGKDVEVAEVGRGGVAGVALKDKRVSAYSASFVDMLVIQQQGIALRPFQEGPTQSFFSDNLTAKRSTLAREPKLAVGFPRALAKATLFCVESQDACWKIIVKHVPDTGKKPEFTRALLRETLALHQLPPEANGRWGFQRPEAWKAIHDYLLKSGQLSRPVDVTKAYTNEYIGAINEFDAARVRAEAAAPR